VKSYSLTRRLIVSILVVELLAATAISGAALLYERHARFRAFDVMLRGRADSLLGAVVDAEDTNDSIMLDGTESSLPAEDVYEVQDAGGRVLGRSSNWTGPPSTWLSLPAAQPLRLVVNGKHYHAVRLNGVRGVDPGEKGGGFRRPVVIFYGSSVDPVWRDIWQTVGFYAATSLGLLALSGWWIFRLLDRGLAPLRQLAREAQKISVNSWNFAPPPSTRGIRELAPLTAALETTLARLERSFSAQQRFISDAAHELKTAVAVTKSSLQLLTLRPRTAQEYEHGIERCQLDCERLEDTVSKMLTLARLETGDTPTALPTDLSMTLQRTSEQFSSMADLRRVRLTLDATDGVMVEIEPQQLQLLCSNLLLNALQHSPPGTSIRARVEQLDGEAKLTIEDEGDGIPAEDLPHVFERFYRGDPSRSRNTGGTGLGLAISKAIVEQWRGAIEISSVPGSGTTVQVSFPALLVSSGLVKVNMRD
jgi:signal transduction histidine kinase